MLNPIKDGANLFVDSYTVQYMGATLQGKLFGYSMTLNGYLLSLPIAFGGHDVRSCNDEGHGFGNR